MMSGDRSGKLVMGLVSRMTAEAMRPFFLSLERVGYQGDICMIVHGLDASAQSFLRARRVHLIPFSDAHLSGINRHAAFGIAKLMSGPDRQLFDRLLAPAYMHPHCARHFFYEPYLRECAGHYGHVLLTDVRDVLFQADPFAFGPADGLHVFREDRRRTIGTCEYNAGTVRIGFGEKMLAKLRDQPVNCAGTIIGTTAAVHEHVRIVIDLLCRARQRQTIDQATYNVALLQPRTAPLHFHENFAGPVLTMSNMDTAEFVPDAEGRFRNYDGSLINILHQYDRYPALAKQLVQPFL
jgi:hypothetical protein